MDARAAAAFLDEFGKVSGRTERPQTFMEIAGYPHYENVCSNFLAFFFDPEGPHGLGSLFLEALSDSVSIAGAETGFGGNVYVEREVGTAQGNRIDILIRSDSHAVLIENKIFAAVANPFEDHAEYLDSSKNGNGDAYEDENKIRILLTLYPSGEGAEWCFVNLTHAAFASAVRPRLGHRVSKADTRYLTFLLDFLNTLEHLGEGTRMNQGFVKLLAQRSDEVEKFLASLNQVRSELREKIQQLGALMSLGAYPNVEQIPWRPNIPLVHFLQHDIRVNEQSYIGVDTGISPSGWETQIFARKTRDRSEVEDLLNRLEIPFEKNGRFVHPTRFDYDEDLSRIAPAVQEIVDKIARAVG